MSTTPTRELVTKALTRESDVTKEELKDILHVIKQIFGVVFGVAVGTMQLTGLPVILGFVVISYLFFYGYVFRFLQIDEDVIEGTEVFKEAFMLSFFSFVLAWLLTYSKAISH